MANPATSPDLSASKPSDTAGRTMRVLVSGSSGLIGSHLCGHLSHGGHGVRKLVRRPPTPGEEVQWDPAAGRLHVDELAGIDAFIHLSGENIAGRWTDAMRQRIRDSRINTTRLLADAVARLQPLPRVLIVASAIGYYGDRGDELLTEDSLPGCGFLPEVCTDWEAATHAARDAGVRVVNLRCGLVLSKSGGVLATMLGPFQLGLGGVVGSGQQWMSWIALSDLLRVFEFLLSKELSGPVNAVSPQAVTNREFTKTLGTVLHRPTILPIPAALLQLGLGQMANETLLASAHVIPERLLAAGFVFEHPHLEEALRHELVKQSMGPA